MRKKNSKIQTKEDVWGIYDIESHKRISNGLIVAGSEETCPIFNDKIPYKSVTVVCDAEDEDEVIYWLIFVQGGDCISMRKDLQNGTVALRADYQCW